MWETTLYICPFLLNAKAIQSEEMVSELAELYATGWGPIKMTA